jgi:hypothetical protein
MSGLAPNLFDKRFQDLMEIGRARLPSLAPDWTDHNAHDPGITLMELLAWVAEAQLYSLGHMRRDERVAYAALLGFALTGTVGATGLIWPDRLDPSSPVATYSRTMVLSKDTVIHVLGADSPTFRPRDTLLWVPGSIQKLVTRHSDGQTADHTSANGRGVAFLPFGERAGRRDVLSMVFQCRDEAGLFDASLQSTQGARLFEAKRQSAQGARLAIGVLAAPPIGGEAAGELEHNDRSPLKVTLVINNRREAVAITSDTTQGLLTTGAIMLNLDDVKDSPREFTIELNAPGGFPRPPRLLRIEPNVIPIEQGRTITRELHEATGMPDWNLTLEEQGLRFATGEDPVTLEVAESSGLVQWSRCESLSDCGPNDQKYELDAATGRVTFGNGVNGGIPEEGSRVLVSYAVSDADTGVVARNRKWQVAGFEGAFGVNPDPVTGGALPPDGVEQRRKARQRSRKDRALVTAQDIVEAALALPLLEVARAWVPDPYNRAPQTGAVTLVAMRSHPAGIEPELPPETARWLETIRSRLAPRMPLGSRLVMVAPRYVVFSIQAELEADLGRNPSDIKKEIEKELQKRLALVASAAGVTPRQPGMPVTSGDVKAWLRAIDGVKRVVNLQLVDANGEGAREIAVPRNGLPRWNSSGSTIEVKRPGPGGTR